MAKEKTVPCFKISLHIHLRSQHFLAKGTEAKTHGYHTLNMQKQLCLQVYEAMGLRRPDGTWAQGADVSIYSRARAFRVLWARKLGDKSTCFRSVNWSKKKGTGKLEPLPGAIGDKACEDALFKKFCRHSASLGLPSAGINLKYQSWCKRHIDADNGARKLTRGGPKAPTFLSVDECKAKAKELGADFMFSGRGHRQNALDLAAKAVQQVPHRQPYVIAYDLGCGRPTASLVYRHFYAYILAMRKMDPKLRRFHAYMADDRWSLVFDIDGPPTPKQPLDREIGKTLRQYLIQIATMLDEVYDIGCKAEDMLVLDASGKTKAGKFKTSFHIIVPEYRVAGMQGRRQLQAIMSTRQRHGLMSRDFDAGIYNTNHMLRSARSGKLDGLRPLLLAGADKYKGAFVFAQPK